MDEEEFEIMVFYFLFLRRKPKINCAKKWRFWVRYIFQKKKKRLGDTDSQAFPMTSRSL